MSGVVNTAAAAGPASSPKSFELLAWSTVGAKLPTMDITVVAWDGQIFFTAYWDADFKHWVECASGGKADGVTHWAEPRGPGEPLPATSADFGPVQAALREALTLLSGWIEWRCPKRYQAEHRAALGELARAGGVTWSA